jgi:RNA recognition motif-containing protein
VDFTSIDHATSVLINPKNHHLNGRDLVVQYAGADAVRRGAVKTKPVDGAAPKKGRRPLSAGYKPKRPRPQGESSSADKEPTRKHKETKPVEDDSDSFKVKRENPDEDQRTSKDGVRHKGPRTRPKPGAALALAKRESAAIIPSQGQKITF